MSVKRLIIVADRYDLEKLVSTLVSTGVEASEIHISKDQGTAALAEMGVKIDVPSGRIPMQRGGIDHATLLGVP